MTHLSRCQRSCEHNVIQDQVGTRECHAFETWIMIYNGMNVQTRETECLVHSRVLPRKSKYWNQSMMKPLVITNKETMTKHSYHVQYCVCIISCLDLSLFFLLFFTFSFFLPFFLSLSFSCLVRGLEQRVNVLHYRVWNTTQK